MEIFVIKIQQTRVKIEARYRGYKPATLFLPSPPSSILSSITFQTLDCFEPLSSNQLCLQSISRYSFIQLVKRAFLDDLDLSL